MQEAIRIIPLADGGQFEIHVEDTPMNPRIDEDNLGQIVCFHNRYDIGDKHSFKSEDHKGWDELKKAICEKHDVALILPVYMYEHSGVALSTACDQFGACDGKSQIQYDRGGWDWVQVGFIYVTTANVLSWFDGDSVSPTILDQARQRLLGEIETFGQWMNGEVYGFIVRNPPCEKCGGEGTARDSCWGFYGMPPDNGMLNNLGNDVRKQVEAEL